MTKEQIQQEALSRATQGMTATNYPAIFQGFMSKGIPQHDIEPRENVFTYQAWQAKGRQVRKGERGVKVVTVRQLPAKVDKETDEELKPSRSMPWSATVFHVSQTDPADESRRFIRQSGRRGSKKRRYEEPGTDGNCHCVDYPCCGH